MFSKIREMGALRNGLHGLALVFTALMPFSGRPDYSDSWDLFFGGILPATAPIIVIVIGFDIMMSSIQKSEASAERVAHFNNIIKAHWIVGGILLAAWLAVFLPALL